MAGKKSVSQWEEMFNEADTNKSGSLDFQELKALLKKGNSNLTDSQIKDVFDYFDDANGKVQLTFAEFEQGIHKIDHYIKQLFVVFKQFDADNNNYLDRNELTKVLLASGHIFTPQELDAIMKRADPNGNGKITFEDFVNACT